MYVEPIKGIPLEEIRSNYDKFMQISEVLEPKKLSLNRRERKTILGMCRNFHIYFNEFSNFKIFRKYYRYYYRRYGWFTITFHSDEYFYFSTIKKLFEYPLIQMNDIFVYRTRSNLFNINLIAYFTLLKSVCNDYNIDLDDITINFNKLTKLIINKPIINEVPEKLIEAEYNRRKKAKKNKSNINPVGN